MTDAKSHFIIHSGQPLQGTTAVPGDKSISHRAVLFGMLAQGQTRIRHWLAAGDTEASLRAAQTLGIRVERHDLNTLTIHGGELRAPGLGKLLNLVNAGTGMRLLTGIMVGQPFESLLTGSDQLRRRPMKRIIEPLSQMGAHIDSADGHAPLRVRPASLKGIRYEMPVASAQVKSALLLAGLFAEGETTVVQPGPARDHTERMLGSMGVDLTLTENYVTVMPGETLHPLDLNVPGDFSSAAFLIVAGTIVPESEITLTGVNLNLTRTGLLDALVMMGADLQVTETGIEGGEPVGEIRIRHAALKGVEIGGDLVVRMIDEFPVLMVAALCAEGETVVRDAQELRVKETDRIAVMAGELRKFGAQITETTDGFRISGPQRLKGAVVHGHDDHRVAMSMAIAGLIAEGETIVQDAKCAGDSFPGFGQILAQLNADLVEAI